MLPKNAILIADTGYAALWTGTLLAWSLQPAGSLVARVERDVGRLLEAWTEERGSG